MDNRMYDEFEARLRELRLRVWEAKDETELVEIRAKIFHLKKILMPYWNARAHDITEKHLRNHML